MSSNSSSMKRFVLLAALGALALAACNKTEEVKLRPEVPAETITLSSETLSIIQGEEATIRAIAVPEDAWPIAWASADPSVASVSKEGVVKGVSLGETDIFAISGRLLASCHVTVVSPINGITLNEESIKILNHKTFQLEAEIDPADATEAFEWISDKPEIATVDEDGLVTAVGVGKATISAKATHAEAKCEVEVLPAQVEKITLDPPYLYMTPEATIQVTATVLPEDAEDKTIVWSVQTEGIVTVEDGLVTAVGEGKTYIRATASNDVYASAYVQVATPASLPFSENFNDTNTLTYWTSHDIDGDGNGWYTGSNGDNGYVLSYSYYNYALTPDDWLFTPPIQLDETFNQLGFHVWPYSSSYPIETYGAYILTDFTDPDGRFLLAKGTLTEGVSYLYEKPEGGGSFHETNGSIEHVVVDIPDEFKGKVVYFAFRHFESYDNYALILDDLVVSNTAIEREVEVDPEPDPEPSPAPKKPFFKGGREIPKNCRPLGNIFVK